ncbi:hypothetical protein ACE1SV_69410 [Streptomyces sp. E-15]
MVHPSPDTVRAPYGGFSARGGWHGWDGWDTCPPFDAPAVAETPSQNRCRSSTRRRTPRRSLTCMATAHAVTDMPGRHNKLMGSPDRIPIEPPPIGRCSAVRANVCRPPSWTLPGPGPRGVPHRAITG